MGIEKHFCGFKTAFFVDASYDEGLAELISDDIDRFFTLMGKEDLPEGWEFRGTDESGAAGYVVTFDIDGFPNETDMEAIKTIMDKYDAMIKKEKWEAENIFSLETFEDWSVYELTEEIESEARRLWDTGLDYAELSEKMGIGSKLATYTGPWVKPY